MDPKFPMRNTTLCYLEQDNAYLMLHRVTKKNDLNHDKWIGVGGKFEPFESPEDCLLREVQEAAGAAPLVQPGALDHAAQGQIDELACKAVPDPPASLASVHELPLLPRMPGVVPQTDGRAVLRVEVLDLQHLPIGCLDEVKLIFQ